MIARMGILFFLGTKQTQSNEDFPNNGRFKLEMGTAGREEQHPAPSPSRARGAGSGSSRSQDSPTVSTASLDPSQFSFTTGRDSWTGKKKKMMGEPWLWRTGAEKSVGSHMQHPRVLQHLWYPWHCSGFLFGVEIHQCPRCFVFKHLLSTTKVLAETPHSDKFSSPPAQPA